MPHNKPTPKELKEQADALLREAVANEAMSNQTEDIAAFDDEMPPETTGEVVAAEVIEQMEEEARGLQDKNLRLMAEMENLRRRTEREIRDASRYAIAKFAGDILSVSDNLSRALAAIPEEGRSEKDDALSALIEGMEMTERDLQDKLEKHGVRMISPEGEKFDPNLHQAIFEVPNPDVPNGTIVQVVQAGFVIGERVLRPAMVGVAKGGPKGAADTGTTETGAANANTAPERPGSNLDESA